MDAARQLTTQDLEDCTGYEIYLRGAQRGTQHCIPVDQPSLWNEYIAMMMYGNERPPSWIPACQTYQPVLPMYQPYLMYQPPPRNNTVSMPAEALDPTTRAIGRPHIITQYIRHPTPIYNTRGRGGYRGGYRGRGGRSFVSRRVGRLSRDEITDQNPTAWVTSTVTPAPVINEPTAPTTDIDHAFLNDSDLTSNAGDDIVMVNDTTTVEGNDAAVEDDVAV